MEDERHNQCKSFVTISTCSSESKEQQQLQQDEGQQPFVHQSSNSEETSRQSAPENENCGEKETTTTTTAGPVAVNLEEETGDDKEDKFLQEDSELPLTFPQRLYDMLSKKEHNDILGWLSHGKGFIIKDKTRFADELLSKFMKKSKFTSFTRKLNRWNFTRVTRGPETGAYYHPLFLRGQSKMVLQMSCTTTRNIQLQPMNPVALGMSSIVPTSSGVMAQATYNFGAAMMQQQMFFQQQQAFLQQMVAAQTANMAAVNNNTNNTNRANDDATGCVTNSVLSSHMSEQNYQQQQQQQQQISTAMQESNAQQQMSINLQQQQFFGMLMAQQAHQQQMRLSAIEATPTTMTQPQMMHQQPQQNALGQNNFPHEQAQDLPIQMTQPPDYGMNQHNETSILSEQNALEEEGEDVHETPSWDDPSINE